MSVVCHTDGKLTDTLVYPGCAACDTERDQLSYVNPRVRTEAYQNATRIMEFVLVQKCTQMSDGHPSERRVCHQQACAVCILGEKDGQEPFPTACHSLEQALQACHNCTAHPSGPGAGYPSCFHWLHAQTSAASLYHTVMSLGSALPKELSKCLPHAQLGNQANGSQHPGRRRCLLGFCSQN